MLLFASSNILLKSGFDECSHLGNCKNSVGLKPNAELRKDAKAPSAFIGAE